MQPSPDLNLLVVFDALIEARSVTGAAAKLGLSVSACSRAMGRARRAFADPILVPAGRTMVPTVRALELRADVDRTLREAKRLLHPRAAADLHTLERTFRVRCNEVCAGIIAGSLFSQAAEVAPRLGIELVSEDAYPLTLLRSGEIDLVIGHYPDPPPECTVRHIYTERLVGLVREGHPLVRTKGCPITPATLATYKQVAATVQRQFADLTDHALAKFGVKWPVGLEVPGFYAAALVAAETDCIATVPKILTGRLLRSAPVVCFELPFKLPSFAVRVLWHPRSHAEPGHAWLREAIWQTIHAVAKQR